MTSTYAFSSFTVPPTPDLYASDQYLIDADFADCPRDSVDIMTQPTHLPPDVFFASPNPTLEGCNGAADQLFPQTLEEVFSGAQYPWPINTTATPMMMSPWGAALYHSAGPQAQLDTAHTGFQVPQQTLAPSLSVPPLLCPQPPIAHQDSSLSEPIGCTQPHSFLCASNEPTARSSPKDNSRSMRENLRTAARWR